MPIQNYTKPYLTIPRQIQLLKDRGMVIENERQAKNQLERIGYYRLSGYWYPFRKRDDIAPSKVMDDFIDGTTFQQAVELYVFDRKLRLLFLDAIERIEVALRVDIALLLGIRDPWAHREARFLNSSFQKKRKNSTKSKHEEWLEKLDSQELRSKQEFAVKYRSKYHNRLPLWMTIEVWDFGMMSHFLNGMKNKDQDRISGEYNLPRRELLISWMRALNFARNACAHHSRLWNISPADQPRLPLAGDIPELDHLVADNNAKTKIYAHATTIQFLLKTINPEGTWANRLEALIETLPKAPNISPANMGFPDNWQKLGLWT